MGELTITITLSMAEYEALMQAAARDARTFSQQARYLLRGALIEGNPPPWSDARPKVEAKG